MPRTPCRRHFTPVLVALVLAATASAAQTPGTQPVPDAAAQARLLEGVRFEHRAAYEKAKGDVAARQQLAVTLLDQAAQKRDDPTGRFVRLQQARELAAAASDAGTALAAVDELTAGYALDGGKLKTDTLRAAAEAVTDPEKGKSLADLLLRQTAEALAADDYDTARTLTGLADVAARKAKQLPLVLAVRRERRGVELAEEQFGAMKAFTDRLKADPTDAVANRAMGRYLCLLKGDWERGLYLLAQGDEPKWRALAQRDLAAPEDTGDRVTLGHRWWDAGEAEEGPVKVHLRQRAVYWYDQAVADATGKLREQLQERIAATPAPRRTSVPWDHSGPPGVIRILGMHPNNVYGVAFAPDGRCVLSGSVGSDAAIWDVQNGRKVHNLVGHQGMLWSVTYDPQGRHAFTASWDGTVKMWDARTGKEVRRFPAAGRIADVNGIAVSPDGRHLLTGSDDSAVRIWDVKTGQQVRQMNGHQGFVYGVAWSPDGSKILSGGSTDNTMTLWDARTGQSLKQIRGIGGPLRTVAFSPDGRKATAAGENVIRLWDLQTGREVQTFRGHTSLTYAVAFSPDGRRLASGAADNTVRYWDVATGRQLHVFHGHNSAVFSLAFSPGGGRLVTGSADNSVRLWGLPR